MLIRQKSGWRLHHQAYLWPRANRTSAITPPLLLPRVRRNASGTALARSGGGGGDSPSSTLSPGRSSSSSCVEGDDASPTSSVFLHMRTPSIEAADSPSSLSSSSDIPSPRKRKRSTSADAETPFDPDSPLTPTSRRSSSSSDPIFEYTASFKRRRSSSSVINGDEFGAQRPAAAGRGLDTTVDASSKDKELPGTCSDTRRESACPGQRRQRETRSSDSKGIELTGPYSCSTSSRLSNLKGSFVTLCSRSGNNNHIPHCGSNHISYAFKDCIRGSNPKICVRSCKTTSRMGVLCTEIHDREGNCDCEGLSASSPRPALVHPSSPSPCEINLSSGQNNTNHVIYRKRPHETSGDDANDKEPAVVQKRMQRSPSMGSINGYIGHVVGKNKLSSDIATIIGQNGMKPDQGLNGVKLTHGYQNGTRPFGCLGLDARPAINGCMAHHHPVTSSASSSISSPRCNGLAVGGVHKDIDAACQPCSESASTFAAGSIAHTEDGSRSKRPQPPSSLLPLSASSLSSSAASIPQLQQLHHITQGPETSTIGSKSNADDSDGCGTTTTLASHSKCISSSSSSSSSSNSTVLSLRQRPLLGKSQSQPASPQASSGSSQSTLISSSSLPQLSTLGTEPSSPVTPSAIQCRWRGCSCELDASDLLEHIRKHVEAQVEKKTYACLWTDCKVFNKPSWSSSWLERHIVSHSGHRPFKCILDNCGQRFHTHAALERHVNGHFTANNQNGSKSNRTREEISQRMLQKRKKQLKRRFVQTVKRYDFFDEQTLAVIKQTLVSLAEQTKLDITGTALRTTFHGLIVGKRSTKSGNKQCLVEFTPTDVLEDAWIPEENARQMSKMSVPLTGLPIDTVGNLHDSLYRQHRFRKHRRK